MEDNKKDQPTQPTKQEIEEAMKNPNKKVKEDDSGNVTILDRFFG